MQMGIENDEGLRAHRPTFAGYSEDRLRQVLTTLDPSDPIDREMRADIERRLELILRKDE